MRKLAAIALLGMLLPLGSCDKGFEDLNVNPNIPESTDPAYLFAYAQHAYFTDYFHGVLTETWGLNVWMQTQADLNGIATLDDAYFVGGDALDNTWSLYYARVLGNLDAAARLARNQENFKQEAAITVFRVYVLQQLTDLWGDIPYTEAFGAVTDNGAPNYTPAYDGQASIYTGLLDELADARNELSGAEDLFGGQDWIGGGLEVRWRELANALTLRMCIRMSGVDPELAMETANALLAEETLPQSDALFTHSSFARSPFYELHNTGQGMRNPSAFLVELFKATDDPRLAFYAELAPETIVLGAPDYVGVPNFLIASEIDTDEINAFTTSYIGEYFQQEDGTTPFVSHAEVQFLLAEAALLGWNAPQSAAEHFAQGLSAHMDALGVNASESDAYLAANPFNGSLQHIAEEKWKTFVYTNPIEQFAEYRRTGFPVLTRADGSPIPTDQVPKRLAYPNTEISLNGSNVSAVGVGINDFHTPLWWDVD